MSGRSSRSHQRRAGPSGHEATLGQRERRLARHREQDRRRHHLVDDPGLLRLRRPEGAAGQDQVEGPGETDEPGHALRPAGPGEEAELHLGKPESRPRVVRGHAVAAGQRGLEAAAQAGAVDGRDHRHAHALEAIEHGLPRARQGLALERAPDRGEVLDVGARDEVVGLAALEHDGADALVGLEKGEDLLELGHQGLAQGVDLLAGHVEGEDEHAVVAPLAQEGPAARGNRVHAHRRFGRHRTTPDSRNAAISSSA